ncbi:pyridoxal-phosphate dependent enzyme [Streptomyces sp. NBC_01637]|uniref:pyridoxal-phosphate dependent enzyme n=1 Tax=unclassified Streptomyces TaxID=2593676 RepID=UPI0038670C37|nr:pyridoxal-phosphate dependent enzyme [Streptomyces sp. NBC_01653]WTC84572.1 pyridoxal-phosphate dependent enzyme [Streptomyces sp. NBC_01653]WTD86295.1 pyridoxal-phosphate dependent enzyme [Streptomyces sp. NBC_01637]WTD94229.1 pyridoxal-phosphate dependent enzyme [Streptomyces sp. NBC_01637]
MSSPILPAPSDSIVEASVLPRLIRLGPNLCGAAFTLMKLLPARFMIDRAEQRGDLRPGTTVLETSSGTFALGLAMVCRLRGYPLVIVGDPAIDPVLRRRLLELNTRVEICHEPSPEGGFQRARLDRLEELRAEYPNHYVPGQYHNRDNPNAYASVAEQLTETLGLVDCLVGPVGSGGSTGGTAAFLRLLQPQLHLIGVDTSPSAIFGQPDGPRTVRGLGNSLVPPNVRHAAYDEVHWTGPAEVFQATRELHARHALYMGPTSGAAYLVARWYAERHPDAQVVALLPDEGHRYQDTVYQDDWLASQGFLDKPYATEPRSVTHPGAALGGWARMDWRRRTLEDALHTPHSSDTPQSASDPRSSHEPAIEEPR